MARYGVILHTPWRGNTVINRTFDSKAAARKFAKKLAIDTDITANSAIFPVSNPSAKEWMF